MKNSGDYEGSAVGRFCLRLAELNACPYAQDTLRAARCSSWKEAWGYCARIQRVDWLLWYLLKVGVGPALHEQHGAAPVRRRKLVALMLCNRGMLDWVEESLHPDLLRALRAYVSGTDVKDAGYGGILVQAPPSLRYLLWYSASFLAENTGSVTPNMAPYFRSHELVQYIQRPPMGDGFDDWTEPP